MLHEKDLFVQKFNQEVITGVYIRHIPTGVGYFSTDKDGKRSIPKHTANALKSIDLIVQRIDRCSTDDCDEKPKTFNLETNDPVIATRKFVEALRKEMQSVGKYSATLLDGSRITVRFK